MRPAIPLLVAAATVIWTIGACSDSNLSGPKKQGSDLIGFGQNGTEACGNGLDDNGNGMVDENCACTPGETQQCCYTGGPGGTQTCVPKNEKEFITGSWGPCENIVSGSCVNQSGSGDNNSSSGSGDNNSGSGSGDNNSGSGSGDNNSGSGSGDNNTSYTGEYSTSGYPSTGSGDNNLSTGSGDNNTSFSGGYSTSGYPSTGSGDNNLSTGSGDNNLSTGSSIQITSGAGSGDYNTSGAGASGPGSTGSGDNNLSTGSGDNNTGSGASGSGSSSSATGGGDECICKAGTVRFCDTPEACLWGKQTCKPDFTWGKCLETNNVPSGCATGVYDMGCCLNHPNACCQNPFTDASMGECTNQLDCSSY